jgi:hypothetical protein
LHSRICGSKASKRVRIRYEIEEVVAVNACYFIVSACFPRCWNLYLSWELSWGKLLAGGVCDVMGKEMDAFVLCTDKSRHRSIWGFSTPCPYKTIKLILLKVENYRVYCAHAHGSRSQKTTTLSSLDYLGKFCFMLTIHRCLI